MRYHYSGRCVEASDLTALNNMIADATEITRKNFLKHVVLEDLREQEEACGYAKHWKQGLTMAGDWHVTYHSSHWNGKPCYFFRWSAIEYYFFTPRRS